MVSKARDKFVFTLLCFYIQLHIIKITCIWQAWALKYTSNCIAKVIGMATIFKTLQVILKNKRKKKRGKQYPEIISPAPDVTIKSYNNGLQMQKNFVLHARSISNNYFPYWNFVQEDNIRVVWLFITGNTNKQHRPLLINNW